MSDIYDVVIVGGGLAGCAAAIHLRRTGKAVILIEKEKQAHHKVCGEFLSYEAVQNLQELGIDLKTLGAVPITQTRLIKGNKTVSAPLSFQAQSVSRYLLDEAVLNLAQDAGAVINRGVTITDLVETKNGWAISGKGFKTHSKALVLATGKHDVKNWQRPDGVKNDYIGFKMHYDLPRNHDLKSHTDVMLFKGGYAGLQPIENGKINLCLVVEKNRFAKLNKNWDVFLKDLCDQTPQLATLLKNAKPCWDKPLAIFGIPYGYVYQDHKAAPHNLYRLGDQMAVIPSFAGGGMAIALYTAKLAVQCYLSGNAHKYNRKAHIRLKYHIRKSTWLGILISSSFCQHALLIISRIKPSLLTFAAKHTRLKQKTQN